MLETECRLRDAGCGRVETDQADDPRDSSAADFASRREYRYESTLQRQFTLSTAIASALPWVRGRCLLPDRAELFRWAEWTDRERAGVAARPDVCPLGMSPFRREDTLDTEASVGLRVDGRVAGWLLAEKLTPDTVLIRTMYVLPEFDRFGIGFAMAAKATCTTGIAGRYPYIRFSVLEHNRPMLRLVEKRCAGQSSARSGWCDWARRYERMGTPSESPFLAQGAFQEFILRDPRPPARPPVAATAEAEGCLKSRQKTTIPLRLRYDNLSGKGCV